MRTTNRNKMESKATGKDQVEMCLIKSNQYALTLDENVFSTN